MRRRHRGQSTDFVEADLPITPMLDMSFQLLAFFIMTFKPSPTEGQIAMSLPPNDPGGPGAAAPLDFTAEKPMKWVARVIPTDKGAIGSITLRDAEAADQTGMDLGADPKRLLDEAKKLYNTEQKRIDAAKARGSTIPPPKLTIEIGDSLLQGYVIQLFDAGKQAGFTEIAPVPIPKPAPPKK
jgi:Biopolymer transport protein ExbD/TolR